MDNGMKTYGMEVDIHTFPNSTVQGEWSTSLPSIDLFNPVRKVVFTK
jgi:hypothetical protein